VLAGLYRRRIAELPPSVFLVEPGWMMCIIPAIILGIFTAAGLAEGATRLVLGRRYQDYVEWEQGRTGLEGREAVRRMMLVLGFLIVLPLTLFVTLGMDWYTRFGEEEIAVNGFWDFGERVYPYARVRHVVRATHLRPPVGEVKQHDRLFIVFDDGQVWCNEDVVQSGHHFEEDLKVAEFVCRKAGKTLQVVEYIEDVTRR
jgi:hypothetical protein